MSEKTKTWKDYDQNLHSFLGIQLNNQTWNLIEKKDRTPVDDATMVHFAHGSLYHWQKSPKHTPVNSQRGEWLIARVYAVLKDAEKCTEHATACLELTEKNPDDMLPFDNAFALESVARANALAGRKEEATVFKSKAVEAGNAIPDEEDRKFFQKDFENGDWFGI